MLVVSLLGGRKELLYTPLVNYLASSGYRVAAASQVRKAGMTKEMRDLAMAGAGLIMLHSASRAVLSTTYVPETLDDLKRVFGCLAPVKPDVIVLLGFLKLVRDDESVLKALAVWSSKEAESLLSDLTPPVVGVYSVRRDYRGEGGYDSPEELARAVVEEGMRRKMISGRMNKPY